MEIGTAWLRIATSATPKLADHFLRLSSNQSSCSGKLISFGSHGRSIRSSAAAARHHEEPSKPVLLKEMAFSQLSVTNSRHLLLVLAFHLGFFFCFRCTLFRVLFVLRSFVGMGSIAWFQAWSGFDALEALVRGQHMGA